MPAGPLRPFGVYESPREQNAFAMLRSMVQLVRELSLPGTALLFDAGEKQLSFSHLDARSTRQVLNNMREICVSQIPAEATVAIKDCKARGGKSSIGAFSRYAAVVAVGSHFWRDRPKLGGAWSQGEGSDAVVLSLSQSARHVTGSWHSGTGDAAVQGEFRGTVISRDQDSVVKGYAKVTKAGNTVIRPMSMTVDPDTPNQIGIGGLGLAGVFTRG